MKKHIGISLFFMGCFLSLSATNYFVATNGDDSNAGTLDKPFATLQKAQSKVVPGDTVYIRGGEYRIREEQMMGGDHLRAYVFEMNKSGTQAKRICYTGYQDERPIFNLAEVKPEGKRVSVFYVSGSYLHFRNFEIIKTQVLSGSILSRSVYTIKVEIIIFTRIWRCTMAWLLVFIWCGEVIISY